MSTEYRRGIPSTAHVEAATRLGLLWGDNYSLDRRWHFEIRDGVFHSDFESPDVALGELRSGPGFWMPPDWVDLRPIRPDGTLVDWEVLDQEVARVGQQGQPQGFRATLFGMGRAADFLARWTVYQELKPLYDIVDGGEGCPVMPPEMQQELGYSNLYRSKDNPVSLDRWTTAYCRRVERLIDAVAERRVTERGQTQAPTGTSAPPPVGTVMVQDADGTVRPARMNDTARVIGLAGIDMPAAVRAAAAAQPEPRRFADVRPDRHGWRWWRVINWTNGDIEIQPNEWRWYRGGAEWHSWGWGYTMDTWMSQTVIPTDEQGDPVSWESIVSVGTVQSVNSDGTVTVRLNGDGSVSPAREGEVGAIRARWAAPESFFSTEPPTPPHLGQFSNNPAMPPLTPEGFRRAANLFLDTESQALLSAMQNYAVPGIHITVGTGAKPAQTEAVTTPPLPLPRFTTDELDDVDHSKTTKLDEVTLRRGKLPTVEQIAKYREVRARRTGGAVADALKESRIDCEVAQYVLERWAGGLGDEEAHDLIHSTATLRVVVKGVVHIKAVDSRVVSVLSDCYSLDTSETPNPTAQRERQEAEERRQRLAELRQRLSAERAAPQEMANESEASRFDLIEPDPQADPAASIRAWEARQAAAKVRPIPAPPRIAKPAAAPRRPAIEVVDTEVDGLSRVDVVTVLVGRAFNGGC